MDDRFKFRAWDTVLKKMIYSGDEYNKNNSTIPLSKCLVTNHGIGWWVLETLLEDAKEGNFDHWKMYDGNDLIKLQSTGQKDKARTEEFPNGKLIFDGDIAKALHQKIDCECNVNTVEIRGQIKYLADLMTWAIWVDDSNWEFLYALDDGSIEILGNIHQHPHLLEKVEEDE